MATTQIPATPRRARALPKAERKPRRTDIHETGVQLRVASDAGTELPPGVCGRIVVTALTFNEVDTYGTSFAPGCADRSIGQRVPAGRLPLLTDHDNAVRKHVGVVRAMPSVGEAYLGECDILDTEDGRRFLEYAKACVAAGAVTGASIRFVPRASELVRLKDGSAMERFTEIELRELTVVPMSSVPNTDLLAARAEGGADASGEGGGNEPVDDPEDEDEEDEGADPDGADDQAKGARADVDSPADDVSFVMTACRTLLGALPPEQRAALLQEYTETDDEPPARADAATARPSPVQMASEEARIRAVRELMA